MRPPTGPPGNHTSNNQIPPSGQSVPGGNMQQLISEYASFQRMVEAECKKNPGMGALSWSDFIAFKSLDTTATAPLFPNQPPGEPSLNMPNIQQPINVNLQQEFTFAGNSTGAQAHGADTTFPSTDTGHNSDDEREANLGAKRKFDLHAKPFRELSKDQQVLRNLFQAHIRTEMQRLTGLRKDPFPLKPRNTDSDDDLDPDSEDAPSEPRMLLRMDQAVDHPANIAVIQRAATLVMIQELDVSTRTMEQDQLDITWTREDLVECGKGVWRTWKRAWKTQHDGSLSSKKVEQQMQQRRQSRQHAIKERRMKAVRIYTKRNNLDPSPMLQSEWMTEEVSGWSDADETANRACRREIGLKMGYSEEEIAAGVKVLEKRSLGWRSKQINSVYHALDDIVTEMERKRNTEFQSKFRRVDLGRKQMKLPARGKKLIYPMMISSKYVPEDETLTNKYRKHNPPGFNGPYSTDEEPTEMA
ncbi:hypothetical protein EUX98_g9629 [Antrodiella citrinella]|uniref:Uncharacterized protein n=1 Tax=Antrodiella citrinella TaxID=2447956 RepID=A0A4V3XEM9_9APHY|nr:hypothetical protein EUX98_g9629 [Antrodiella citrinella]